MSDDASYDPTVMHERGGAGADAWSQHVSVLGDEMAAVYRRIWSEVVEVQWEWKQYVELFARKERVDALNDAVPAFAFLVQHTLEQHVLTSIANLTDREKTGRQENLTVRRLSAMTTDPALRTELDELVARGDAVWGKIREWRHKRLAHLDLEVALARRAAPVATIEFREIESALASLRGILDAIERKCSPGVDVRYDVVGRAGEADDFLWFLDIAKQHLRDRRR